MANRDGHHQVAVSAKRVRASRGEPMLWIHQHLGHEDPSSCLPWPFASSNGRATLSAGNRSHIAHREMCRLAHGEPPSARHHAAHSCGKGHEGCMNPHHLYWATPAENEADKRTSNRGERHGMAKLTAELARKIRDAKGVVSQRRTASLFNVSRGAVNDIWTGRTWSWAL